MIMVSSKNLESYHLSEQKFLERREYFMSVIMYTGSHILSTRTLQRFRSLSPAGKGNRELWGRRCQCRAFFNCSLHGFVTGRDNSKSSLQFLQVLCVNEADMTLFFHVIFSISSFNWMWTFGSQASFRVNWQLGDVTIIY